MKKLLFPDEWECGVLIADIRKNGESRIDEFELELDGAVEYAGQPYSPKGPVFARVASSRVNDDIVVRVELTCELATPCFRCLDETSIAINGDMRYIFTLRLGDGIDEKRGRAEAGENSGEPDGDVDAIKIEPFNAELDLAPYIWETLILNVPARVLCR
jgi:uncharacterized metal-binding protein YceD (DUF177 family)